MTDTIIHYSITHAHDTDTRAEYTHTISISIFLSLRHTQTHTHTRIKPFIDSLTTWFHLSIFQQRVKDEWMKRGIEGGIPGTWSRKLQRETDAVIKYTKKTVHKNIIKAENDWSTMWNKKELSRKPFRKEERERREMERGGNVRGECDGEKLWCSRVKRVT